MRARVGIQPIRYKVRTGEEGIADAYVTNEVDTWGKRTLLVTHNGGNTWERWYLFPDEWEYDE